MTAGAASACWLYVGRRYMNSSAFKDAGVDEPDVYGIDGVLGLTGFGLSLEGGYLYAEDAETNNSSQFDEYFLGLRQTFLAGGLIQPYIGAGVSQIEADLGVGAGTFSDNSTAGYAHLGVAFQILLFQLGLDYRVVAGSDLTLAGAQTDADYQQLALTLGVSF